MVVGLWNEAPVAEIAQYVLDQFPRLIELRIIGGKAEKISIRSTRLSALSIVRNTDLVLLEAKEWPKVDAVGAIPLLRVREPTIENAT
jgi:hypothetical protein